jgi:ADP-ribose pyrophosphatase YjhB (NUDIX family)
MRERETSQARVAVWTTEAAAAAQAQAEAADEAVAADRAAAKAVAEEAAAAAQAEAAAEAAAADRAAARVAAEEAAAAAQAEAAAEAAAADRAAARVAAEEAAAAAQAEAAAEAAAADLAAARVVAGEAAHAQAADRAQAGEEYQLEISEGVEDGRVFVVAASSMSGLLTGLAQQLNMGTPQHEDLRLTHILVYDADFEEWYRPMSLDDLEPYSRVRVVPEVANAAVVHASAVAAATKAAAVISGVGAEGKTGPSLGVNGDSGYDGGCGLVSRGDSPDAPDVSAKTSNSPTAASVNDNSWLSNKELVSARDSLGGREGDGVEHAAELAAEASFLDERPGEAAALAASRGSNGPLSAMVATVGLASEAAGGLGPLSQQDEVDGVVSFLGGPAYLVPEYLPSVGSARRLVWQTAIEGIARAFPAWVAQLDGSGRAWLNRCTVISFVEHAARPLLDRAHPLVECFMWHDSANDAALEPLYPQLLDDAMVALRESGGLDGSVGGEADLAVVALHHAGPDFNRHRIKHSFLHSYPTGNDAGDVTSVLCGVGAAPVGNFTAAPILGLDVIDEVPDDVRAAINQAAAGALADTWQGRGTKRGVQGVPKHIVDYGQRVHGGRRLLALLYTALARLNNADPAVVRTEFERRALQDEQERRRAGRRSLGPLPEPYVEVWAALCEEGRARAKVLQLPQAAVGDDCSLVAAAHAVETAAGRQLPASTVYHGVVFVGGQRAAVFSAALADAPDAPEPRSAGTQLSALRLRSRAECLLTEVSGAAGVGRGDVILNQFMSIVRSPTSGTYVLDRPRGRAPSPVPGHTRAEAQAFKDDCLQVAKRQAERELERPASGVGPRTADELLLFVTISLCKAAKTARLGRLGRMLERWSGYCAYQAACRHYNSRGNRLAVFMRRCVVELCRRRPGLRDITVAHFNSASPRDPTGVYRRLGVDLDGPGARGDITHDGSKIFRRHQPGWSLARRLEVGHRGSLLCLARMLQRRVQFWRAATGLERGSTSILDGDSLAGSLGAGIGDDRRSSKKKAAVPVSRQIEVIQGMNSIRSRMPTLPQIGGCRVQDAIIMGVDRRLALTRERRRTRCLIGVLRTWKQIAGVRHSRRYSAADRRLVTVPYVMIYIKNRFHGWAYEARRACVARAVATASRTQPERSNQTTQADTVNVKEVYGIAPHKSAPVQNPEDCMGIKIWERMRTARGPVRTYNGPAGLREVSHAQPEQPPEGCGHPKKAGVILIRMVSGVLQWCDARQCEQLAPQGLKVGKKLTLPQEVAETAHRLELHAAKIALLKQLQEGQRELEDNSLSTEDEVRMAVAQLGVPVFLVSPVLAGGKAAGFRPTASIDAGFISMTGRRESAAYNTCTWDDEHAVVETFSPGRLQNGDWVTSGEGRVVRSEDVHLAGSAEDLMALMQALGPEYWTDHRRNATCRLPDSVRDHMDQLFAPDSEGQPARIKQGDEVYREVMSKGERVEEFPELIRETVKKFPEFKHRKGVLASRASTRWKVLRRLVPSLGMEVGGGAAVLFKHKCLGPWFYEEWLGSARRSAVAPAAGGGLKSGLQATPADAAVDAAGPGGEVPDDESCDDVRAMGTLAAYLQDQLEEVEALRAADASGDQAPLARSAAPGQRTLGEFEVMHSATERALELERAALCAERDAVRARAEYDSVAVMIRGKKLQTETVGESAANAVWNRDNKTCLVGFNPGHTTQWGRLTPPMGKLEFVGDTSTLETPQDAARREVLEEAGLLLPVTLEVSEVVVVTDPDTGADHRVAVFYLGQTEVDSVNPDGPVADAHEDRLTSLGYRTRAEITEIVADPPAASLGRTGEDVLVRVLARCLEITEAVVAGVLASNQSSSDGSEGQLPTPIPVRAPASADEESSAQFTAEESDDSHPQKIWDPFDEDDDWSVSSGSDGDQDDSRRGRRDHVSMESLIWWARMARLVRLRPMFKAIAGINGGAQRAAYTVWRRVFKRNQQWGELMAILCSAGYEAWLPGERSEREAKNGIDAEGIGERLRVQMLVCEKTSELYADACRLDRDGGGTKEADDHAASASSAESAVADRSQMKDRLRSRAQGPAQARIIYTEASEIASRELNCLDSSIDSDSADLARSLRKSLQHTVDATIADGYNPTKWPTLVVIDVVDIPGGRNASAKSAKYASHENYVLTTRLTAMARTNCVIHGFAARLTPACADEVEAAGGLVISSCDTHSTTAGPHAVGVLGNIQQLYATAYPGDGVDATPQLSQQRAQALANPDDGNQTPIFTVLLSVAASQTGNGEQSLLMQRCGATGPYDSIVCAEWGWNFRDIQRDDMLTTFSAWGQPDWALLKRAILLRLEQKVEHHDFSRLEALGHVELIKVEDLADGDRPGQLRGARYVLDFWTNPHTHPLPLTEHSGPRGTMVHSALEAYAACALAELRPEFPAHSQQWQPWPTAKDDLWERPEEAPDPTAVWLRLAARMHQGRERRDVNSTDVDADQTVIPPLTDTAAGLETALDRRLEAVVEPALRPAVKRVCQSYNFAQLCQALDDDATFGEIVAHVAADGAPVPAPGPGPPAAADAASLRARSTAQPGAFARANLCANVDCCEDTCEEADCGAGVGPRQPNPSASHTSGLPADLSGPRGEATLTIEQQLLTSIHMRDSTCEDSLSAAGSGDVRVVVMLQADTHLDAAIRSGHLRTVREPRLVPVPSGWGTAPTTWTLQRLFIDYQLTEPLQCAENIKFPAGTFLSCTTGDGNLLQVYQGHRPATAFYAVPETLAFELTMTRARDLVGIKCAAGGQPDLKGSGSGGGGGSTTVLSPGLAEWNSLVSSGNNRLMVDKAKAFAPVFQQADGRVWRLAELENRGGWQEKWFTSKTITEQQDKGELKLAVKSNGQVDATRAYAFAELVDGGITVQASTATAADKARVTAVFKDIGVFRESGDFHRYWTYGVDQNLKNLDLRELSAELISALLGSLSTGIKTKYENHCKFKEMNNDASEVVAHVRDVEKNPALIQFIDHLVESGRAGKGELPFNCGVVELAELVFWLMSNYSSETPWLDQLERMVLSNETVVTHWCPPQTKDIDGDYFKMIELPGKVSHQMETYAVDDRALRDQALIGLPRELLRRLLQEKKDQWLRTATYADVKRESTRIWGDNEDKHWKWTMSKYRGSNGRQLSKAVSRCAASGNEVLAGVAVTFQDAPSDHGGGVMAQTQHPGVCYNCGELGHQAKECPKPTKPKEATKIELVECWNCGQRGHYSQDCSQPKSGDKWRPSLDEMVCHRCGKTGHVKRHCTQKPQAEVKTAEAGKTEEGTTSRPAGVQDHPQIDLGGTHAVFGGGVFEPIGELKDKKQLDFYNGKSDPSESCSHCNVTGHNDLTCHRQIAAKYKMLADPRVKNSQHRLDRLLAFTLHELRFHSHGKDSPISKSNSENHKRRYDARVKATKALLAARAAGES